MGDAPRPRAPDGLGNAGRRLWRAIVEDLDESLELDARERLILAAAARQADLVASLEAAIRRDGVMIRGSQKQRRLNSAVTELRQSRLALARLLGDLGLPDPDALVPPTAAGRRASRAAQARWAGQPRLRPVTQEAQRGS